MLGLLYDHFLKTGSTCITLTSKASIITQSEVEEASRAIGYNVFFIEPIKVERALKQLPEIKSVHVATGFPNILLIQIEERTPSAVWLKASQKLWVDDEGSAFQARVQNADLSTVRDLDPGELKPGMRIQPAALTAVRAVRDAWSDAPEISSGPRQGLVADR
jgi:cell division septal protein FtsQ